MARRRAKDPLIGHFDSFQMHPSNPRTYASGGQNLAALRTTAGQNLAAVGSSHSLPETVDLGSVTLAGLVGTLHWQNTSCKFLMLDSHFSGRSNASERLRTVGPGPSRTIITEKTHRVNS